MGGHYGGNPLDWQGGTNAPHITRYFLARGFVMPWETVLDAGCGVGYGSRMIAQVAEKVIGTDVDEACIDSARTDAPENCSFIAGSLTEVELPMVDVTIAIESLEHVVGFEAALKNIQDHTKRMIIFTVPIGGTTYAYKEADPNDPATEVNDFPNEAAIEKLFATNGWRIWSNFRFGYSYFGIYIKESLTENKEGYKRIA